MHIPTHSPLYQKAFEQYLRKGTPMEISLKALLLKAGETIDNHTTTHYSWRTSGDEKVRASHAANDGKIIAWKKPLATGHPAKTIIAAAGQNRITVCPPEPGLDPVYPELLLIPFLRIPRLIAAWRAWVLARRASREWQLSKTKSAQKWANRMEKGSWIPEKITQTIKNGTQYKVKNERTGGAATRYE
jgi:hypothetical protein